MARPIYKLCLIRGFTEAYYQLSDEARANLWESVGQAIDKAGAKMAGPYYDCRWSNDKYVSFFLMEYPSIDAAIEDTHGVEQVGLFRYLRSETILAIQAEAAAEGGPGA